MDRRTDGRGNFARDDNQWQEVNKIIVLKLAPIGLSSIINMLPYVIVHWVLGTCSRLFLDLIGSLRYQHVSIQHLPCWHGNGMKRVDLPGKVSPPSSDDRKIGAGCWEVVESCGLSMGKIFHYLMWMLKLEGGTSYLTQCHFHLGCAFTMCCGSDVSSVRHNDKPTMNQLFLSHKFTDRNSLCWWTWIAHYDLFFPYWVMQFPFFT